MGVCPPGVSAPLPARWGQGGCTAPSTTRGYGRSRAQEEALPRLDQALMGLAHVLQQDRTQGLLVLRR